MSAATDLSYTPATELAALIRAKKLSPVEYMQALLARITVAQEELEQDGTLPLLRQKWLGNPDADQSSAVR